MNSDNMTDRIAAMLPLMNHPNTSNGGDGGDGSNGDILKIKNKILNHFYSELAKGDSGSEVDDLVLNKWFSIQALASASASASASTSTSTDAALDVLSNIKTLKNHKDFNFNPNRWRSLIG